MRWMGTWWVHDSGRWSVSYVVAAVLTVVARPRVAALAAVALDRNGVSEANKRITIMPSSKNC